MLNVRQYTVTVFVLQCLGFFPLLAFLFTVFLSTRVNRHPVFISFVYTWVLYSGLLNFAAVASLTTGSEESVFEVILLDVLWMTAQVSTLNLVIHLWFTMRAALHTESARAKKLRTVLLVVTPYLFGLLPMVEYAHAGFDFLRGNIYHGSGYAELALIIITSLWDAVLLVTFWRQRRILRRANIREVVSLYLLTKIFVFCLYRLTIGVLYIWGTIDFSKSGTFEPADLSFNIGPGIEIAESFYPLLVFCLLGLQRDILHVWFPCVWKRPRSPVELVPSPNDSSSNNTEEMRAQWFIPRARNESTDTKPEVVQIC